jgi:hypothetical protein
MDSVTRTVFCKRNSSFLSWMKKAVIVDVVVVNSVMWVEGVGKG